MDSWAGEGGGAGAAVGLQGLLQDKVGVQQRYVEQNCEAPCVTRESSPTWVWWRRSPT